MELRCSGEQTEFESKKMVGPSQRAIEELEASVESDSVSELDLSNSRKSTSTGTSKTGEAEDEVKIELAKRETVVVNRLRFLVFLILLLAAVSVSIIVYYITSEAERQEFENQYEGAADKILSEFVDGVKLKLGAAASLGVAAVAYGVDHSIRWPFVTVSSFHQRAGAAREQSDAIMIHINPVISESDKLWWEMYVLHGNESDWIDEAQKYQDKVGLFQFLTDDERSYFMEEQVELDEHESGIEGVGRLTSLPIWYYKSTSSGERVIEDGPGPYFPKWQSSPVFRGGSEVNENGGRSNTNSQTSIQDAYSTASLVMGAFQQAPRGGIDSEYYRSAFFAVLLSTKQQRKVVYEGDPISRIAIPIFDSFQDDRQVVAIISAWVHWANYFKNALPESIQGVILVLRDSCGGEFTYIVNGNNVSSIGTGDHHSSKYTGMRRSASFASIKMVADGTPGGVPFDQTKCPIQLDVYPSEAFYKMYETGTPMVVTFAVAFVFLFTAFMFLCYDRLVERRQAIVLLRAEQTTRIVSSLFPQQVADRLIQAANNEEKTKTDSGFAAPTRRLKSFLAEDGHGLTGSQPIADLFPNCTVLFADISGFTAWSSTRDPAQVFILLQTIYQAFDAIAKRRKVFKVETIGDSYVAVTGLPDPQDNHAVIMARFAGECLAKMNQLTAELEASLGPDTGDLAMRFGMNSGPVTAGVLQGDRARFQLFGDTVNTAARMESTGIKNKIQVSQTTHDLLIKAGKAHWLRPRTETVEAKGKGIVQTYWVYPTARKASSASGSSTSDGVSDRTHSNDADPNKGDKISTTSKSVQIKDGDAALKRDRLVDWVSDILLEHLKTLVAVREATATGTTNKRNAPPVVFSKSKPMATPMDELAEIIHLPTYNAKLMEVGGTIHLDPNVSNELHQYVSIVASTYRDNYFHNFEHACHVTMAVNKLLKRIVSPDIMDDSFATGVDRNSSSSNNNTKNKMDIGSKLHDYTHGITSDPLTRLAIVFSALIHDADHRGVSNVQLMQEQKEMAALYRNQSVAEQNSVDISWDLLMSDQFRNLRACLFTNAEEFDRFRQVVVNVVLATDIFDKELGELRLRRWQKAFAEDDTPNKLGTNKKDWNDMRATIVIEHIIQASDVAHTMQHWHVYRKWNKRLLMEMYAAYQAGRMSKDPTTFWYEGELGFFDHYVIPLARKLKECNVFGVSSDECLNYATQNRAEWADRGPILVEEMKNELVGMFGNVTGERESY